MNDSTIILGSQSPQRLQLLSHLIPRARLVVRPPQDSAEPGFAGLTDWTDILDQLRAIAALKHHDVRAQSQPDDIVLTADTIIVSGGNAEPGTVLGKPREPDWQADARNWLKNLLSGRFHRAATALQMSRGDVVVRRVNVTSVQFNPIDDELLAWYLSTHESRGKAGGYAIQGAGSVLVQSIQGSLSNVIGLPLEDVRTCLPLFD